MNASAPHFLLFCESREQTNSQRQIRRWRFVLESLDGAHRFEASDEEPEESGTRLDLLAVVRGLEALNQPSRVTLVTGSRYVTHGLQHGLQEWRSNQWRWERFGKMARVRNSDLWKRVDRALGFHQVQCRNWRLDHHAPEGESKPETKSAGSTAEALSPKDTSAARTKSPRWRPMAGISGLIRQFIGDQDRFAASAGHLCPIK